MWIRRDNCCHFWGMKWWKCLESAPRGSVETQWPWDLGGTPSTARQNDPIARCPAWWRHLDSGTYPAKGHCRLRRDEAESARREPGTQPDHTGNEKGKSGSTRTNKRGLYSHKDAIKHTDINKCSPSVISDHHSRKKKFWNDFFLFPFWRRAWGPPKIQRSDQAMLKIQGWA